MKHIKWFKNLFKSDYQKHLERVKKIQREKKLTTGWVEAYENRVRGL